MFTPRSLSILLTASLVVSASAQAQDSRKGRPGAAKPKASAAKLYRWTDAQGKVHYTDTLPSEALEQGRTEYSRKGSLLNEVQRPPTAEEKALQEQQLQQAQASSEQEQAKARDLLAFQTAYPSEEAIGREFLQRKQTLEGQVKTIQGLLDDQRKTLISQLETAANAELLGKTISPKMAANIQQLAKQVRQHEAGIKTARQQILELVDQEKQAREQWASLQQAPPQKGSN